MPIFERDPQNVSSVMGKNDYQEGVNIRVKDYDEEEDSYGDLLDNLLSDEAESPKSEDQNSARSPTFQSFWNSADTDDEEFPVPSEQKNLTDHIDEESRDDRNLSFYSDHQNENEKPYISNGEHMIDRSSLENVPTHSPKAAGKTMSSPDQNSTLRSPLATTSHHNVRQSTKGPDEIVCDVDLPKQYERSMSPVSAHVHRHSTFDSIATASSATIEDPMILDLNDILPSKSAETEAIKESDDIDMTLYAASSEDAPNNLEISAKSFFPRDSSEISETVKSAGKQNGSDTLGITAKTSLCSDSSGKVETIDTEGKQNRLEEVINTDSGGQAVTLENIGEPAEVDPNEWAYNVWKRKGLMAGVPTAGLLPQPEVAKCLAEVSKKPAFEREARNQSDRLSLPAKIAVYENQQNFKQKTKAPRNEAGFSILLNKWKEKSDDNPNAHFLSPREHVPEKTKGFLAVPTLKSNNKNFLLSQTSKQKRKSFDPSSMKTLSQSKSRNDKRPTEKALGSESTLSRTKQQHTKMPSKDKNALSRYLQRPKQTSSKKNSLRSVDGSLSQITETVLEMEKEIQQNEVKTPTRSQAMLMVSPLPSNGKFDGGSRRSLCSTSSTKALFSPADDTVLDPREVMGHRRQNTSDHSLVSKNTMSKSVRSLKTEPSDVVPFKEIFIIRDSGENPQASGDDVKSVLSESVHSQGASQAHAQAHPKDLKAQITNLQDILETRVDSMSFDSQSQITHVSFRSETLQKLDSKVSSIGSPTETLGQNISGVNTSQDLSCLESPSRENLISEMGDMTGATPQYSERPWRKDLLVRNVTTAMEKARGRKVDCDCGYSLAIFSENDEMVDFFLPLMAQKCSCRKSKHLERPNDPTALENILRPWQITFLKAFGISKGDQLVKAHHRSAK